MNWLVLGAALSGALAVGAGAFGAHGASGEAAAASAVGKSAVPAGITAWPGRNFKVAGFGVDSVWINMAAPIAAEDMVRARA